MGVTFLGFVSLLLALIAAAAVLVALALGLMFGLHKYYRDKLTDTHYGEFDFDAFTKDAFNQLVIKLATLFVAATFFIHMLYYLLINRTRHRSLMSVTLFVLETAAIAAGLFFLFRLDRFRLAVLTTGCAIGYILLRLLVIRGLIYG
jgi:hypothetical protein